MTAEVSKAEGSKTLDRGLRLLRVLADADAVGGLTISELAARLETGRPVVYRLVSTLEDHGFVVRLDGRVQLGLGLHRLAGAVLPSLRERVLPVLRTLAEAAGATAHLTVVEGAEAVALVVVEPTWTDLHVAYRTGARHPLDRGAAGRAILAARQGEAGLVTSLGDLQTGAHGIAMAVPARESGESPFEASVGVVSLHELDVETVGPTVRAAALELSRLG